MHPKKEAERKHEKSKEEAREIIKQFRDRQGNSIDDIEAFDMAIKALEQQSSDDCISRAEAIKIIKEHPSIVGNRNTIVQNIFDLPSVTPMAESGGE